MNELKIFENPAFGQVRTVEREGEPWFVGKDVAEALGYKDTINALKSHVDPEDKQGGWQITTPGGTQEMTIINESGLYSLVLSSKLPTAKAFKRWITSEVIPSIRKNGGYIAGQAKNAGSIPVFCSNIKPHEIAVFRLFRAVFVLLEILQNTLKYRNISQKCKSICKSN